MARTRAFALAVLAGLLFTGEVGAQLESPEAALAEANRLSEGGDKLEALMLLQDAASRFPDDGVLQYELAVAFHALNRFREALTAYGRAVELVPNNPTFRLTYGGALYQSGEAEAGRDQLLEALEHPEAPTEALVVLAAAYEKLGESEAAFAALDHYLDLEPHDDATRFVFAEQLIAAKDTKRALVVLKTGLDLAAATDGPSAELYHRIAETISRGAGEKEDLERYARMAIKKDPDFLAPRLLLARRLGAERAEEAVSLLEPALDQHGDMAELHFALAGWYQRLELKDKAEQSARTFQRLSKQRSDGEDQQSRIAATYKRASDLLQRGNMLEAESVFGQVLELEPEHAQTRAMLAKIAYSKQDMVSARLLLDEALERDSMVAEYHYLSALFFFKANDLLRAEAPARKAVELDPGFPDAWSLLGTILSQTDPAEAVDCFVRAASLEPTDPVPYLNLAGVYASMGNADKERWAMERYEARMSGQR